jgi:hypothetical protein
MVIYSSQFGPCILADACLAVLCCSVASASVHHVEAAVIVPCCCDGGGGGGGSSHGTEACKHEMCQDGLLDLGQVTRDCRACFCRYLIRAPTVPDDVNRFCGN